MSWNPFKKMEIPEPTGGEDPYASPSEEDPFASPSKESSDPFTGSHSYDSKEDPFASNKQDDSFASPLDSNDVGQPGSSQPPPDKSRRPFGLPPPNPTPQLPSSAAKQSSGEQSVVKTFPLCGFVGGMNFLKGGQLGAGFGLVIGAYEGGTAGLWREPTRLLGFMGGRMMTNAFQFGAFLGVFSGVKCSCEVARGGTQDAFNAGVGGAVAGSLSSLRTRNPMIIAPAALFGGVLMMVLETIQGPEGGKHF
mmetsp:Transcript_36817/g.62573  ORF Transcript_36817/g.62573 Transcript_36817/m.62573 type:complete len:250 (-) Transcript_36817:151-900(-)